MSQVTESQEVDDLEVQNQQSGTNTLTHKIQTTKIELDMNLLIMRIIRESNNHI